MRAQVLRLRPRRRLESTDKARASAEVWIPGESNSLRRCSLSADRCIPARRSRRHRCRQPGPQPSRRPPGSSPARAAHALRPPLKGPAHSHRVVLLLPPPDSPSYKLMQGCPGRSFPSHLSLSAENCRAAEEVYNWPHSTNSWGIPSAEGIVAVGWEFPEKTPQL